MMGPAALGQTISVVDRSGKVISTSKTLLSVIKDAKSAYRERKAEIVAERHSEADAKRARRALTQHRGIDDGRSVASRNSGRSRSHGKPRAKDSRRHDKSLPPSPTELERGHDGRRRSLDRRHTAHDHVELRRQPLSPRSVSFPDHGDDAALAYGEVPPPLPLEDPQELELRGLMSKVTAILDEAHCVQHSVTATIASLQKNPDALAAVALTLAEISNVVAKMAPGALAAMKGSFPAAVALLASPQFMIAAGVGVGVVVVALGGYKIIKKIKERNAAQDGMDELIEIGADVNRIEAWRRGVEPDADDATSVEGDFMTPQVAAMRRAEAEAAMEDARSERSRRDKPRKGRENGKEGRSVKGSRRDKPGEKKPSTLQLLFR
ncbi:MAG: hypothetical protein M1832_005423 [Thelocarpon impressellum]|nr:MAG: hypothetical protein M1832_005423 [Thelocarpon impressellum]